MLRMFRFWINVMFWWFENDWIVCIIIYVKYVYMYLINNLYGLLKYVCKLNYDIVIFILYI